MIQLLSEALGEFARARSNRFAQGRPCHPMSEITSPEEGLAKLEAQKQRIDAKIGRESANVNNPRSRRFKNAAPLRSTVNQNQSVTEPALGVQSCRRFWETMN